MRRRAVLGAGTILTRSTPLYDVVRGEVYRASGDRPLVVPENAVVVPGSRALTAARRRVGTLGLRAGDHQVPRREDGRQRRAGRGVAMKQFSIFGFSFSLQIPYL